MSPASFRHIQEGDEVIRLLAESIKMPMRVTKVDETLIYCQTRTFDRTTGVEIDHDLGWGPSYGTSGSRLL